MVYSLPRNVHKRTGLTPIRMIQSSKSAREDNSEEIGLDDEFPEEDSDRICPLCGLSAEDSLTIYTHLQVGHRKSEIAGLVVDK